MTTRDETVAGLAEVLAGHDSVTYHETQDLGLRSKCKCGEWLPDGHQYVIHALQAHLAAVALAHLEAQGWVQGREELGVGFEGYEIGSVRVQSGFRDLDAAKHSAAVLPRTTGVYRRRVSEWEPAETGDHDE